jgi:hypothetical protein
MSKNSKHDDSDDVSVSQTMADSPNSVQAGRDAYVYYAPPTPPFVRPAFQVTVPVTSYPGLVRLDLNLFQKTKPAEDRTMPSNTFLPILAEFENLPLSDGESGEVKEVWAQIRYRNFDFLGIEMARVNSGCWVEQGAPDITFPLRAPHYLVLGGWKLTNKGEYPKNEIAIFEFDRNLHRAIEKTQLPGPRQLLVDLSKGTVRPSFKPMRYVVQVALTSNAHHDQSCEYEFQLTIFGPTGYSINCVKQPSLS